MSLTSEDTKHQLDLEEDLISGEDHLLNSSDSINEEESSSSSRIRIQNSTRREEESISLLGHHRSVSRTRSSPAAVETTIQPPPPSSSPSKLKSSLSSLAFGVLRRQREQRPSSAVSFWNTNNPKSSSIQMSSILDTVLRRKTPSVKNSLAVVGLRKALLVGKCMHPYREK